MMEVQGCHGLRGRRRGSSLRLDVHIQVDPWLSVSAAHGIGEAVRHQIQTTKRSITEAYVHIEPASESASEVLSRLGVPSKLVGQGACKVPSGHIPGILQVRMNDACEDIEGASPGSTIRRQQPEVEKHVRAMLDAQFNQMFLRAVAGLTQRLMYRV
eukprot:TRINITY_DN1175_c0_g1_i1.p2 TRINITY_DN1175_c0_g1~~TRINITY_DN1175_c0_g1_i1.p2  ORF type:complete len:157 (+),score=18.16 TRINITY_DN1175_c0_g1_i1:902-1372(+)